jgi:hypothetical protein
MKPRDLDIYQNIPNHLPGYLVTKVAMYLLAETVWRAPIPTTSQGIDGALWGSEFPEQKTVKI